MSEPEWSKENIDKLAQRIVDDMTLEDLMCCVKDDLERMYYQEQETFLKEWGEQFGGDDENPMA